MKIRCIDKEDPPCRRCRNMGLECAFEGVPPGMHPSDRPGDQRGSGRCVNEAIGCPGEGTDISSIEHLETQMSTVTQRLDEISSLLIRLVPENPTNLSGSSQNLASLPQTSTGHPLSKSTPLT